VFVFVCGVCLFVCVCVRVVVCACVWVFALNLCVLAGGARVYV